MVYVLTSLGKTEKCRMKCDQLMMNLFGRSAHGLLEVINRHSSGRAEAKNEKTFSVVDTSKPIQNRDLQTTDLREYCCESILNGWSRSPRH